MYGYRLNATQIDTRLQIYGQYNPALNIYECISQCDDGLGYQEYSSIGYINQTYELWTLQCYGCADYEYFDRASWNCV
jgi:hypothetical protein